MNIGILLKKKDMFPKKLKKLLENKGHNVKFYTAENLSINESLLENDFYILKSKKLIFLYAGFYLTANNIPVIPNPDISYKHKNRLEAHFLIKKINLLIPDFYYCTLETLKKRFKPNNFPLILKPLMGSGSVGVRKINSFEDLNSMNEKVIYLEQFINGTHYLVYFIGNEICTLEKLPLENESSDMIKIETSNDIKKIVMKWKNSYDLLFGHLDIIREKKTNKLYIVDQGSFPTFYNWKCPEEPVIKICDLILKEYNRIKN